MLSLNGIRKFEQRQLFDNLRCYDPWGRAGGGAPVADVRRKDLLSRYIYPQFQATREPKERNRPHYRPKHRPHLSFHNSELKHNEYPQEPFPMEITDNVANIIRDAGQLDEGKFPKVNAPKVWSSNPWEGRGPWGSRGPGGHPWRPAAHVGKNFHHSMGWTTDTTFHFPSIVGNNGGTANNYNNSGDKENLTTTDFRRRKHKRDHKMPAIERTPAKMEATSNRAGGTPNGRLLQMTGGIELVPLMRARAWTHRLKPSESDLYNVGTQPYGIFHRY